MMQYDMPNGHKLYVGEIPNHGVVKATFACRKVVLSETETSYFIEEWLPGFFTPDECLEWLGVRPTPRAADVCPAADNGKHSWHPDKDNYLIYHCIKCGARG